MIFLRIPAWRWRSRRLFNTQEDGPMILGADFANSSGKVCKLFKMIETSGRFGSWWKTSSFYLAEYSRSKIFHKTDQRLSRLPPSGAGISWDVNKRSPRLAGFAQFLFKLWRTAQLGFLARWFCRGGWNSKGGKFRNFESINQMSKVDTEGGRSFCSSPKLFRDNTKKTVISFTIIPLYSEQQ